MLYPKLVAFTTFQAFLISFLLSYYKIEIPFPELAFLQNPHGEAELGDDDARLSTETIRAAPKSGSTKNSPASSSKGQKKKGHSTSASEGERSKKSAADNDGARLFTARELAKYNGEGDHGLYLGLLGRVYDVEKGRKHYGPGGGYHFFAGKVSARERICTLCSPGPALQWRMIMVWPFHFRARRVKGIRHGRFHGERSDRRCQRPVASGYARHYGLVELL